MYKKVIKKPQLMLNLKDDEDAISAAGGGRRAVDLRLSSDSLTQGK